MCCVMGYTGHDLSAAKFKEYLLRTVMRGPDDQRVVEGPFGLMGFGRLAIMGLTPEGMQPFYRGADCVVCNGELYGFRFEKEILKRRGYKFQSDCDCEILLPLYYEYGLDMFRHMDSEFALIMYDSRKDRLIAARDPIGIRPLFYGYSKSSHQIAFASEMQNLIGWCDDIRPFPIGSYYCDGRFVRYEDIADVPAPMQDDMDTVLRNIREKLIAGVEKRLDADAPVGFLLSGGLDSSLVCSIAAKKLGKPIRTFAIGMDTDAIDLKYARQTAEYLGSEHHEIIINRDMVINSLEEVIRLLGTWDITTIRASMGMYLLCKAIHEQTDVRVLLTGEISDELFGYKYTDYAPTADAFQQESQKRIRELYMYDVLRADLFGIRESRAALRRSGEEVHPARGGRLHARRRDSRRIDGFRRAGPILPLQSQQSHGAADLSRADRPDRRRLREAGHAVRSRRVLSSLHRSAVGAPAAERASAPGHRRRVHQALRHGRPAAGLHDFVRPPAGRKGRRLRPELECLRPGADGRPRGAVRRRRMERPHPRRRRGRTRLRPRRAARTGLQSLRRQRQLRALPQRKAPQRGNAGAGHPDPFLRQLHGA